MERPSSNTVSVQLHFWRFLNPNEVYWDTMELLKGHGSWKNMKWENICQLLRSLAKHLCSPEKLYGRSQNIYVLPRNFAFNCKILSSPKKCCLLAKLLSSPKKLCVHFKTFLRSPEKLAVYLKKMCIPQRNFPFTWKKYLHSPKKLRLCIHKTFAFPQETVLSWWNGFPLQNDGSARDHDLFHMLRSAVCCSQGQDGRPIGPGTTVVRRYRER